MVKYFWGDAMEQEYDIVEYKGYLICRWSDLWEIRKGSAVIGTEWTQEDAFAFIDKMLYDAYNERNPGRPL